MGLPRGVDHFLLLLLGQLGQLINVLPLVRAVWHAERETELKLRQHSPAEEVLLDEDEAREWLVSVNVAELEVELQIAQLEEGTRELVLQRAHIHRQCPLCFLLAGEVVDHLVRLGRNVHQLVPRVVVAHAVLAEADMIVVC